MLTTKEAAQYIKESPVRVAQLCQAGKIKARKEPVDKGHIRKACWFITQEALDEYLKNRPTPGLKVDYEGYDLTAQERRVLELRQDRTLAQVGEILGFSRQRVHQIQSKALGKIKKEDIGT